MDKQIKIYFAPFQSITTHTFRKVYSKYFIGVDKLFTPYFSRIVSGEKLSANTLHALKSQTDSGIEIIPQILSKNADEIIWFANNCDQMGFKELNWNLGCPHPQVANKKLGSGLLYYPDLIDDILNKVKPEINIPFSIKCRLGYQSKNEIAELIPVFNAYPIHEISIHARTGRQLYSGKTDMDAFAKIAPQINSPIVYNGDIFTIEDYHTFTHDFPYVNRLMLGRGILKDPFLPAKIKDFDLPSNPKAHVRLFMDDLYYAYRKDLNDQLSLLSALKEYWFYLADAFQEPTKVLRKLRKCKSFEAYEDAVNAVFEKHDLIA